MLALSWIVRPMADADIPSSWSSAGRNALGNSLWILPLVTFERATEGHHVQATLLGVAWMVALGVAVKLHVLEELVSSRERRRQLLTWAFITGGALLLAIGIFRLSSVGISEERRNPESRVIENDERLSEANKQLQAEREARAVMDRQLAAARKELQETQLQRDTESALARNTAAPQRGPIDWYPDSQLFVVSGGISNAQVHGILVMGSSMAPVAIKEAYVVSGLTGRKETLMANVQSRGAYFPVDKVDIPVGAPVQVDAIFNPAIPLREFLDQWGKFRVTIIYSDGTSYVRDYDEPYVRQKLQQMAPGAFGPRVTPRDDKP